MIVTLNELTPDNALVFRLTHIENVAWILRHGLHCKASEEQDPQFVTIGNPDLIQKRTQRIVPTGPGGTLDHYIPFYFTPCSMMLYNIRTGWNDMTRRTPQELVFFVVSLRSLAAHEISFVFSDRHAIMSLAIFSTSLNDLDHLRWQYWKQRDFMRDTDRPEKTELYQAEALVHRHLPPAHLNGIVCSHADTRASVDEMVQNCGVQIEVVQRQDWFF